jgi:hypothetical protein
VEDFFFIVGIWVCVSAFLKSRDAVGLAVRGVDALVRRLQDAGKAVLNVGLDLVKLF